MKIDLTPSQRFMEVANDEYASLYADYLKDQFRGVESFYAAFRTGLEKWTKYMEEEVIKGAKLLQLKAEVGDF
jgi:hypothetical protein